MAENDRIRPLDWTRDEPYWRENYRSRPYANKNLDFEHYRPGYRYGYESADRIGRRPWQEAEPELRRGWDKFEGRGESKWEEMKESVRDAWDRITGEQDRTDRV